jgi:hypothetical protein
MQSDEGVFGNQEWSSERSIGQRCSLGARNDGSGGASFKGSGDEIVTIQALSAHGKEKIAGGCGARVNGIARDSEHAWARNAGRRFENRACPDGRFCECQFHDTPP